ncbi:hypothetical protein [Marivita sp. S2033]|uniref:hypothetical protein n=1 Tax=Marivita sp. S2033 TaxID=3373187 RepID=UPI0039826680
MKNLFLAALVAAQTAALPALADPTPVSEIDVDMDLTAIETTEAASVWKRLPDDLEAAIAARIADLIDENGAEVNIDIDAVSLANALENSLGIEGSTLEGTINITRSGILNDDDYKLTVAAEDAMVFIPEGTEVGALTIQSDAFYVAMIDAFAKNVEEHLR